MSTTFLEAQIEKCVISYCADCVADVLLVVRANTCTHTRTHTHSTRYGAFETELKMRRILFTAPKLQIPGDHEWFDAFGQPRSFVQTKSNASIYGRQNWLAYPRRFMASQLIKRRKISTSFRYHILALMMHTTTFSIYSVRQVWAIVLSFWPHFGVAWTGIRIF